MTKLPWQHNRARTRSGNEKPQLNGPHDWFSRTTSEPSRQALADLVKAHKREQSGGSSSGGKSRSRGNTVTSNEWNERVRADSTSETSWSRPTSSHHGRDGSIYAASERSDGASRSILNKGSQILRRTGSKMSVASAASSSNMGFTSPPRSQSANTPSRADEIRRAISSPFDFQHITHTEQAPLVSLGKIEELRMADPSSSTVDVESIHLASRPPSRLPASPPRPQPPPKDVLTISLGEQKNFEPSNIQNAPLPSPRLPQLPKIALESDIDMSFISAHIIDSSSKALSSSAVLLQPESMVIPDAKPLPELPIFHAVTTEDDSARAMKAAPLPTLPGTAPPGLDGEPQRNSTLNQLRQSVLAPRHSSLLPASKVSMPNLISGNHLSMGNRTLARYHSDVALSEQARNSYATSSIRASASFGAIDTMDWEDAVDEAWDVVDEADQVVLPIQHCPSPRQSYGSNGYLQPSAFEETESAGSTPLMMASPRRTSNTASIETHQLQSVQEDDTDLSGLGISHCPPSGTSGAVGHLSRPSSLRQVRRQSAASNGPNGILTRSSSQDSIILSIASSINATQRSSNSSVSADDLSTFNRSQGYLPEKPLSEYGASFELHHAARPESGCLPSDIAARLNALGPIPDVAEVDEDEVRPIPTIPHHQHSKSIPKVQVPERRSSAIACDPSRRHRTSTASTRPRQLSRVSYSLFPIAQPIASPTAVSS